MKYCGVQIRKQCWLSCDLCSLVQTPLNTVELFDWAFQLMLGCINFSLYSIPPPLPLRVGTKGIYLGDTSFDSYKLASIGQHLSFPIFLLLSDPDLLHQETDLGRNRHFNYHCYKVLGSLTAQSLVI